MRTLASFATTSMLLITSIILSGAVITIPVTLTDTMAFSEKIDQKQIQQKDDDNSQNYQQMYKQYDFVKYLNYHYTYNKEYMENLDSNSDADISEKKPSAASTAIYNNFIDKDNNKKQQQQQQPHSEREKDEDKAKYILELDDKKKKHLADDTKYSSDKNDKKTYKNIKIIECRNFNINAYEIQDLKGIENLLNKPTTFENNDVNSNQKGKSHIENNSREVNEYEINSNTKVIFICNNTNHDLLPINSTTLIQPIPSDGIIIPTHSQNKNNNNNDEDKPASTTISYAQYKKSIANDQN